MGLPAPTTTLRPLGIGEVLDRAVTLCVGNFVVLGLIYAVFILPVAFVQFQATQNVTTLLMGFVDAAKGDAHAQERALKALLTNSQPSLWLVLTSLVVALLTPLPAGALIAATSAFYLKRTSSFAEAYRTAVRRWGQLIGVAVLYFSAGGLAYTVSIFIVIALAFAVGLLYAALPPAGIAIAIVVGLVLFGIIVGALTLAIMAAQVSAVACVVEELNFVTAFSRGISRIARKQMWRRSLLVGLAYFAILAGVLFVDLAGETLVVGLARVPALGVVYGAVVRIIEAAFTTCFVVIFYYDLRVREEGLDLSLLAQAVAPEAP